MKRVLKMIEIFSKMISLCKRGTGQLNYFKGIYDDWMVGWPQDTEIESVFITDYILSQPCCIRLPVHPHYKNNKNQLPVKNRK